MPRVIIFLEDHKPFEINIAKLGETLLYSDLCGNIHVLDGKVFYFARKDGINTAIYTALEKYVPVAQVEQVARELKLL